VSGRRYRGKVYHTVGVVLDINPYSSGQELTSTRILSIPLSLSIGAELLGVFSNCCKFIALAVDSIMTYSTALDYTKRKDLFCIEARL